MENRFEHNPQEERPLWGLNAPPPRASDALHAGTQTPQSLCLRIREMLPSLLESDGEIRPEMASAVFAHLAGCPDCAREFDALQRVVHLIEALPPAEMEMDFSPLIMQRIQQGDIAPPSEIFTPTAILSAPPLEEALTTAVSEQRLSALERMGFLPRLLLAGALTALLAFLTLSGWGSKAFGLTSGMLLTWFEQVGTAVRDVPLLGNIVSEALSAVHQAGRFLQDSYRTLGARAVQGLLLDVALCAGAYFIITRRQRTRHFGIY